jgi:hypothetical protein
MGPPKESRSLAWFLSALFSLKIADSWHSTVQSGLHMSSYSTALQCAQAMLYVWLDLGGKNEDFLELIGGGQSSNTFSSALIGWGGFDWSWICPSLLRTGF